MATNPPAGDPGAGCSADWLVRATGDPRVRDAVTVGKTRPDLSTYRPRTLVPPG
ncbi:MAG TPA: hypothetical protein VN695_02845 [Streptosporangiaceae bacterium]|nr:hypothetical protein [Streptosporangiaceae bacterium]